MSAVVLIAGDTLSNTAESGKKQQQYNSLEDDIDKPQLWSHAKVCLTGKPIV